MLDFQKAFNNIEWPFMFEVLRKFNFGVQFIRWIQVLYNSRNAKVKNNNHISNYFNIQRGIKQGCPISALLFILVIEILAILLKNHSSIKGITIKSKSGETKHLLSQFPDDITLLLSRTSNQSSFQNYKRFW